MSESTAPAPAIEDANPVITYPTVHGGRVEVRETNGHLANKASCNACLEASETNPYLKLDETRTWARDHAAKCSALPPDYVDYAALAGQQAARANALITAGDYNSGHRDRATIHAQVAGVYAALARPQH